MGAAICTALNGLCCCLSGCNSCCKCVDSPRGAKFMYMLMIVWGTIVALVMRYWGNSLDFNFYSFHGGCTGGRCDGVQGVYRCSFALTVFFLFMALTSRCLPGIQRGGWMWKYIILAVLFVCAFLIPNTFFANAWAWISRIGSIIFLVIQILILADFACDLGEFWQVRAQERDQQLDAAGYVPGLLQNKWKVIYLLTSIVAWGGALAGIIVMFTIFDHCGLSKFYIAFTLCWGVIITAMSLSEKIGKGLLPASVVFLYCVYLCWGAVTSDPDVTCNRFANDNNISRVVIGIIITCLAIVWACMRVSDATVNAVKWRATSASAARDVEKADDGAAGPAPAAPTGQPKDAVAPAAATPAPAPAAAAASPAESKPTDEQVATEDDKHAWSFHVILLLGSLYLAMLLTNWGSLSQSGSPTASPDQSKASMWVKIISQWLVYLIYSWIMLAPVICKGRDFSEPHNQFLHT